MQAYDIFMLIVLAAAIAWGAWKGLAWQVASVASILLSYFVALNFRQPLAGLITASPPWNVFLAMLILFLGTGLIVWVGFNLVSELIERVKLKEFDRQLGALFGAAKGVLLCVLITLFSVALLGDSQRQAICNSKSGYYIAVLLDRADAVIPQELHQVLDPYINQLDDTVGQPRRESAGWQIPQNLRDLFGSQTQPGSTPPARRQGPSSFPTDEIFNPSAAPDAPHTTRRIEAKPAQQNSEFRRW
jgi:membrane protein required for colicin V production